MAELAMKWRTMAKKAGSRAKGTPDAAAGPRTAFVGRFDGTRPSQRENETNSESRNESESHQSKNTEKRGPKESTANPGPSTMSLRAQCAATPCMWVAARRCRLQPSHLHRDAFYPNIRNPTGPNLGANGRSIAHAPHRAAAALHAPHRVRPYRVS